MTASKNKWQTLMLIAVLATAWGFVRFSGLVTEDAPENIGIMFDALSWLVIGMLVSASSKEKEKGWGIGGLILGGIILGLLWIMSNWFPNAELKDYGFEFDLRESPIAFWDGIAFLLGYFRNLTMKIPVAVLNQIKKTFGIEEDPDLQGNAQHRFQSYWDGLKSILGLR